jgi:hypothetical protein
MTKLKQPARSAKSRSSSRRTISVWVNMLTAYKTFRVRTARSIGQEDFSAKSAPALSSNLAELRVQLDELMTKVNALVANRKAAARQTRFSPQGVEKGDATAVSPGAC